MKKRILAILMAVMMLGSVMPVDVRAENTAELENIEIPDKHDLIQPVAIEEEDWESIDAACVPATSSTVRGSNSWDIYSNNFYYNQMTDEEQEFYDRLYNEAASYLNDFSINATTGYTQYVRYQNMTWEEAMNIANLFVRSNPQFFFLRTGYRHSYNETDSEGTFRVKLYADFTDGAKRKSAYDAIQQRVNTIVNAANAVQGLHEKEKLVHDMVCDGTTYNDTVVADGVIVEGEEEIYYTQSAYSALASNIGQTVCNGYAQAYQLVMNAIGIDTIMVTSSDHAWNEVRMWDSWTHVDCTWDDQDSQYYSIIYNYYNRSDSGIRANGNHVLEAMYDMYRPTCSWDSAGNPNACMQPSGTVTTPVITKDDTTGIITITCNTTGAKIYYTTDGTIPSVAETKSNLYTEPFTLQSAGTVKAIAALDRYTDSAVAEQKATVKKYNITFDAMGGTAVSQQSVTAGDKVSEPVTTRTGYTFAGWYTDKNCTVGNDWNFATDNVTVDTTLYAKWNIINYTITYVLNGGTQVAGQMETYNVTTMDINFRNPTRKGYAFKGWYTNAKLTSRITAVPYGSTGNKKIYAKWAPITYKITYKLNSGAQASGQKTSYNTTTSTFSLKNPTRKGYVFSGWYTTSKYKTKATKITKGSTGNKTYYAKWTRVTVAKASVSKLTNKSGKKLTISYKKVSKAAGYRIQYSTSKKFTAKTTKNITTSSVSKTVTKLSKGKTYYVRVQAYKKDSKGSKIYGSWSKVISKKITK